VKTPNTWATDPSLEDDSRESTQPVVILAVNPGVKNGVYTYYASPVLTSKMGLTILMMDITKK
jgi:hypothetical protein